MMTMTASSNGGPTFSPYFTARNVSDKSLSITPIFSYVAQDHTEKVSLPSLTLNAQETALVNLRKYQEDGAIPMWVMGGNIDLQYKGESGALVAEMASVDQNGTFVSPVPLICSGNRALHMSFWRTDGDWHSSVTLQNIANEENDVEITISYPGGTFLLEKRIPAGEATMVSVNELQQLQTPDQEGRRIPADTTFGGLNIWSRNVNDGLVINAMTMNPVTKTCGSCGGTGYVNSYALTDSYGCTSGFQTYPVGQSVNLMMSIHWTTSNCSYENPQLNSSSNTGVVNMSLLAVGAGSTSLQATSYQSYPRDISCSSMYHLTSQSGVNVLASPVAVGVLADTGQQALTDCPSIITRQVVYQVLGGSRNSPTPINRAIRVSEMFANVTTNTCGNGTASPTTCVLTFNDGSFYDTLSISCGGLTGAQSNPSCGLTFNQNFLSCAPDNNIFGNYLMVAVPIVLHANQVLINNTTKLTSGTIMPN